MRPFLAGLLGAAALGASAIAAEPLVWQLGQPDGSSREFAFQYHAWEYGRAPAIQRAPEMRHDTHTFHYRIPEAGGVIPTPQTPNALYTITERAWMDEDELVTGLALHWRETTPGRRRLLVTCAKWANEHGASQCLEILTPDGRKTVHSLPNGNSRKLGPRSFSAIFDAQTGDNTLVIRNTTRAKHTHFDFDVIALSHTDAPLPQTPVLDPTLDAFSGICHPNTPLALDVRCWNAPDGATLHYAVRDVNGHETHQGTLTVAQGHARTALPTARKGHFTVRLTLGDATASCAYAVVEPPNPAFVDESPFGCHALKGDGYRLHTWPERASLKLRRAFLGGAKWARLHSVSWALREPQKGTFRWDYLDEAFANAEAHGMRLLVGLGQQPLWASTSDRRDLTVCGNYAYLYYPPRDMADWANFCRTFAQRYGSRVRHYEIGNEPGYSSAFWTCGSAPDYGRYLKAAYDAIKAVQPDAIVCPGAPLQVDFLEEAVAAVAPAKCFDALTVHYLRNHRRGSTKALEWQTMLRKMNAPTTLVDSEDMSWVEYRNDPSRYRAEMVRLHVRNLAQGVIRTFAFDVFDDNTASAYSFFDLRDFPKPIFASYRTMTHRLERARFVGDLSGADYEAYLLDHAGTPVIVFWSDEPQPLAFQLGTDHATLVDDMDNETALTGDLQGLRVQATLQPQYLIGGDPTLLAAIAAARQTLPRELQTRRGQTLQMAVQLPPQVTEASLHLPQGWNGTLQNGLLTLQPHPDAPLGLHDAAFRLRLGAHVCNLPLLVEVEEPGTPNRVRNGDFEQGTRFFFFPKEPGRFTVEDAAGTNASRAAKTTGPVFFGLAAPIRVRPGEKYLLAYDIRGDGHAGACWTLRDANHKTLLPAKPGINALSAQAGNDWKQVWEVVAISHPDAAELSVAYLANHADTLGKTLYLDNLIVARLTETNTVSKILHQGAFATPKTPVTLDGLPHEWSHVPPLQLNQPAQVVLDQAGKLAWNGPDDLSCEARVMLDRNALYLFLLIRDDHLQPGTADHESAWQTDSIQLAIDPRNDGRGYTECLIGRNPDGTAFVYKHANCWTPELPQDIVRRGDLPDAQAVARPLPGGIAYEIAIPIHQLYPLRGDEQEFGFSLLVNDQDGNGRKYIEWASGIGKAKSPALYGLLRRQTP
ncbi:MAG: sugar-binding protein [Oligosphaeraceae bacterium]